jgi:hypothetical protein
MFIQSISKYALTPVTTVDPGRRRLALFANGDSAVHNGWKNCAKLTE